MYSYQQQIRITAPLPAIDRCITEPDLMRRWLNPLLRCESIGPWSTEVGSRFRFVIVLPPLWPALLCEVRERQPGLVEWQFEGFFVGSDRWQCYPDGQQVLLVNRFCFEIPNPLIRFGFERFASTLTRQDMQAQLVRLKQVCEQLARYPENKPSS